MTSAAAALERFVTAVEREGLGVYGVRVRVGDETASHRWRSDDRENLYSVSKGVCAIAAGIAIEEGLLTLETTVGEIFADMPLGAGVEDVTVRRLLTMTSGIDFRWFGHEPVPWPDLAAEMLSRPSAGRRFQYSDASTYVAMRMLGSVVGGTGLELRTAELARITDVLLDRGAWDGRVIVSPEWVDAMHASWVDTGDPAPMDVTVPAHEEMREDRLSELAVEIIS